MKTRLELQSMLENLLGSRNVYFQPPESLSIRYPCIVYSLSKVDNLHGNNDIYKQDISYELIYVDSNPESNVFKKLCNIPMCKFKRFYISENLNHYVFEIYY